jgi:hypothetical protein
MSNVTENPCCEECKKELEKCIDYYSGIPSSQAKCHRRYEACKEEC